MSDHEDKLSTWFARPDIIERFQGALGGWMDEQAFLSQLLISFNDPRLSDCTVTSKFEAANKCALLGLLPGLQHVALIPRKQGQYVICDVMPQWQGYKSVMERHPDVLEVNAELVHVIDEYEFKNGEFLHRKDPFDARRVFRNAKDIKGGYTYITFRDGRPRRYHFENVDYIEKCRQCAQTQNVWSKWYDQMALKTLYRATYNRRIINFDVLVASRLAAIAKADDEAMEHNPSIVEGYATGLPAAAPSRAALITEQLKKPKQEKAPQEEVRSVEKDHGTSTGAESGAQGSAPTSDDAEAECHRRMTAAPTDKELTRVYDEYFSPDSNAGDSLNVKARERLTEVYRNLRKSFAKAGKQKTLNDQ